MDVYGCNYFGSLYFNLSMYYGARRKERVYEIIEESNEKQPKGILSKEIEKTRKELNWPDSSGKRLNE